MRKIITLLMCFALGAACLTGCKNSDASFAEKNYTMNGENITEICIDVWDRQIEVSLSPDNQVHINYFESSKEYYDVSISNNCTLTMTAASNKGWADYIGGKPAFESRKISLQIPEVVLAALKLSTTNEDISLSTLMVIQDISLSTKSGNIIFDKLAAKKSIALSVKNGNISGSLIGGYNDYSISCDSKKGESNIPSRKEGGAKTLTVSNNNGDIDIVFINE